MFFNESPNYIIIEDYDLWLRLAQKGARFYFVGEPLGEYLADKDSLSLDTKRKRDNVENMLKDHVFSRQTFQKNKNYLWQCVQFRIFVEEMKAELKQGNIVSTLTRLIKKVIRHPNCAVEYLNLYVARKLSTC